MSKFGIHFLGNVNDNSVEVLRNQLLFAENKGFEEIIIYLSSSGGALIPGFTAYEYIRSCKLPVTIVNMGSIESVAVIMYLAGSKRLATPDSKILLHTLTWTFNTNCLPFNLLNEAVTSLTHDAERYEKIFKERTANASNPICVKEYLLGGSKTLDVSTAISSGIATALIDHSAVMSLADAHDWPRINGS